MFVKTLKQPFQKALVEIWCILTFHSCTN